VPLKGAVAREAHELAVQRVGERNPIAAGQRVPARHGEHQPVSSEREVLQAGKVGVVGGDADVRLLLGNGPRDFGARPLVEVDVHVGVRGEEGGERFGQVLGHGRGVGQQAHVALQSARVLA
jgi:hypothetical protein